MVIGTLEMALSLMSQIFGNVGPICMVITLGKNIYDGSDAQSYLEKPE